MISFVKVKVFPGLIKIFYKRLDKDLGQELELPVLEVDMVRGRLHTIETEAMVLLDRTMDLKQDPMVEDMVAIEQMDLVPEADNQ